MSRPTVVFDFDGTLALGRGPLDAYAACLTGYASETVVADCQAAVERFDAGGTEFSDAYHAVHATALAHGVTDEQLSLAYFASRDLLGTDAAPIFAPDGLEEFVAELAQTAVCVLATNAPATGIESALTVLGVREAMTEVHCSVGKPAGLRSTTSPRSSPASAPAGHRRCVTCWGRSPPTRMRSCVPPATAPSWSTAGRAPERPWSPCTAPPTSPTPTRASTAVAVVCSCSAPTSTTSATPRTCCRAWGRRTSVLSRCVT